MGGRLNGEGDFDAAGRAEADSRRRWSEAAAPTSSSASLNSLWRGAKAASRAELGDAAKASLRMEADAEESEPSVALSTTTPLAREPRALLRVSVWRVACDAAL